MMRIVLKCRSVPPAVRHGQRLPRPGDIVDPENVHAAGQRRQGGQDMAGGIAP